MKRLLFFLTAFFLVAVTAMSQNNCDLINSVTLNVPETTKTALRSYVVRMENSFFNQVDTGKWNYITWVKTSSNVGKIYKNGKLVASGNFQNVPYSYSRLDLGAEFFTSWFAFFNGLIDEVRISNTIRSDNDILNYYNSNQPFSADANTVGLWHFDEDAGTTANGTVGPAGIITNGTWAPGRFGSCVNYNGQNSRTSMNFNIPSSNMTVEFWIKPNGFPATNVDSRPISLYGLYTTGFTMVATNIRKEYSWSTGDTGTIVNINPTQYDYVWATDGECKDTVWFKTKSTCKPPLHLMYPKTAWLAGGPSMAMPMMKAVMETTEQSMEQRLLQIGLGMWVKRIVLMG